MSRSLLCGCLLLATCHSASAQNPSKPNVLILFADDLGYSDLGCYGGEIQTPHLDSLAANGLRFTQCYNTARCWPSRAALLTGYYAQQVRRDSVPGVRSGGQGVRPGWAKLLPELLKPAGYRSYHSGKWHVDGSRLASGFDKSYSLEDHNHFFGPQNHLRDDQPLPPIAKGTSHYVTIGITEHALDCLREHAAQLAGQPFFSYVAYTAPHFPLHALPEDIAKYRDRYLAGWDVARRERWQRLKSQGLISCELSSLERDVGPPYPFPDAIEKLGPGETNRPLPWDELTDEQRRFQATKMAIHAAMVDRMDQEIGRLLAQLRAMNAFENTLILFASDNGASAEIMVRGDGHDPQAAPGSAATYLCLGPGWSSAANTPFRRHKTWVHEGGISTPLIAHWPKGISAKGELRHNPAHLIDIVPTVLQLAGVKRPETWNDQPVPPPPGRSLLPAFAQDGVVTHDALWWQHEGNRAVRVGDWKLVAAGEDSPWELYDLKADRGETQNQAAAMPEKVRELAAVWTTLHAEIGELARRDAPVETAPAAKKKKRAE
jgi:arylsulfatase A-like enzyme